jgi:hypothetical protein
MCFKKALPSSQIDLYCLSAEISDNNVTVDIGPPTGACDMKSTPFS